MSAAPAVSIIIPAYNCEKYIRQMLESVMAQRAKRYEVIVVDDGSSDGTMSIVAEMARRYGRIRIIQQTNQGPGIARNVGLAAALGDYVLFLDADDFIDPNLVSHAYNRAVETQADIVIYRMRLFDMKDSQFHPIADQWDANAFPSTFAPKEEADKLFDSFKNWPPDKLFRREFLQENEIIFPPLYRTEDLLFTCAALASAEKIALLNEVLYTYRVNDAESSTQTIDRAPLDFYESCRLLKAYLEYRGLFTTYRRTYANWIGLCIIVNLFGMKTAHGFIKAYDTLHNGGMRELGMDAFSAEEYDDPERFALVQTVIDDDLPTGLFRFWHYDVDRKQKQYESDLEHITSSTTFRVGSTLMKIPTKLKDSRKPNA